MYVNKKCKQTAHSGPEKLKKVQAKKKTREIK